MAESEEYGSEERLTQRSINTVSISELPGKRYGLTMEIPMFLIILSVTLTGAAISNLLLYRTCVYALHHGEDVCSPFLTPDKTNVTKQLEEEVQRYTTFVSTVKIVLESVGPAIMAFFLGVWSDTYGRKPLIVWPIFGMTISAMMTVIYSLLSDFGPWWYILTAIPYSLTGGYTVLFTGALCYMSDITTTKNRSVRMTLLEATVSLGSIVGAMVSSYLLKSVGISFLLLIAASLNVLAYAYANIRIKESLTGALQGSISTALDFLLVKEMMRECFKKRPNKMRAQILLLTLANSMSIFILYGLSSLEYMYARTKVNWSLKDYTIYSAVNTGITFGGGLIAVVLLHRVFGVNDLIIALVAFLSATAEFIIKMLAVKSWHMYLGAGVSFLKGLSAPLIRSLLTKILPIEDIAKVFSLMGAIEGICPLFSPPAYNTLYSFTISTFPGSIYLLSAAITGLCSVMLMFVQYFRWKASRPPAYTLLQSES